MQRVYGTGLPLALGLGGVVFLLAGANPLVAYWVMLRGALGSLYDLSEVIVKAIPLMLCGLAVSVAGKTRLWNVGGEGQLVLGGIGAAAVALSLAPRLATPATWCSCWWRASSRGACGRSWRACSEPSWT